MNKDFYNYHAWMKKVFPFRLDEREYDLFSCYFENNYLKHMPAHKESKILEIACGMGQFLFFLKKNGYNNVDAIDLDQSNVDQCKSLGFDRVIEADMYNYVIGLDDSAYDMIVMNDLIEHIPREDIVSFLCEIRKKLKDSGIVMVKTINCNNIYGISGFFADFTHVVGYTPERIKHVSMLSSFSHCKVFNLFISPNVRCLYFLVKFFWWPIYKWKQFLFFLNAKKTDSVFSKNLLAVLYK